MPANRSQLRSLARRAMLDRGFVVDLPQEAERELAAETAQSLESPGVLDLTTWLWSSIDNDESRDLDQIEYAGAEERGIRLYIGIADVDCRVADGSQLDEVARQNTVSVYTGVQTFPMLPERLSTDLSSLNEGERRLAVVVEMLVARDGTVLESSAYPAIVRNQAQLTYDAVTSWLQRQPGKAGPSESLPSDRHSQVGARVLQKIAASDALQEQLRLQESAAAMLRSRRHERGALSLRTVEMHPVLSEDGTVVDLKAREPNQASQLIEDFMIAANQVTAVFVDQRGLPSIRRVVEAPARWDRIVALAAEKGTRLPSAPDARALEDFLLSQQEAFPDQFYDLSLSVIKLLGRGEYKVKCPGEPAPGHFGLAVPNYSHSTAPNRRYADLLMQRLLKAAVGGQGSPYSKEQLVGLAQHCTQREDDAVKVERFVKKCAAAIVLRSHIGEKFNGLITGASDKGTWVRVTHPPVEGRLHGNVRGLEVGDRVRVQLVSTDQERGFIDFEFSQRRSRPA